MAATASSREDKGKRRRVATLGYSDLCFRVLYVELCIHTCTWLHMNYWLNQLVITLPSAYL